MITNIYIKQLFRILKKYGQVNFFKTHVKMEDLQSLIVNNRPHRYFHHINKEMLKHRMLFAYEISVEYDKFIDNVYKKKIVEYLQKENLYDSIKYEYERDDNSWKKYDSFEEYLKNTRWFDVISCAFDWDESTEGYGEYERIHDNVISFLENIIINW